MADHRELDPFLLSRQIKECALRHEAYVGGLVAGPELLDPFVGKLFPGKATYDEVSELRGDDPMRLPLLRWIHRLTDARVHVPWDLWDAELHYREQHPIFRPEKSLSTLSEVRREALSSEGEWASEWWSSFAALEKKLSDHRLQHWVRHREVGARLGNHEGEAFWNPLRVDPPRDEPTSCEHLLEHLARRALTESHDAAENLWGKGWGPFVAAATAGAAQEGWPARLAPDTLKDLLHEKALYQGLPLNVRRLPLRLCPMSFPRAIALVGRALSRALTPNDLPFVVACDPDDFRGEEFAQLFFLWSTSPTFGQRKLALSRTAVREANRHWSAAVLAHLRLAAARYLTFIAANRGALHLQEEFPKITHQLLGLELPVSAALARFRIHQNEATRFVALLSAAAQNQSLIEEHNEDWYCNPRAQQQLREEVIGPADTERSLDTCESGLAALLSRA